MGTEIRTWKIIDDKLTSIYTTLAENNQVVPPAPNNVPLRNCLLFFIYAY